MQDHENIVDDNYAIFVHSTVGEAPGYVDALSGPMIVTRYSKKRYRADVLLLNIRTDKKNRTFGIKEFGNE